MLSANSIMLKRSSVFFTLFFLAVTACYAQSNSPYSRYGLGDVVPNTNIVNRAMGGVAVADTNYVHVNFNNPASYSYFLVVPDPKGSKINYGRVVLDAGINLENRTLREPNQANKFTASDLYFSYLYVGVPLRKKWGMAFGLRPLTRVSYKMNIVEHLNANDSLLAQNSGSGGVYLPTIGTGVAIKNFTVGVNLGYIFGRTETSVAKGVLNDTAIFYDALYKTETSFGKLYADAGMQYKFNWKKDSSFLVFGASGNLKQKFNATRVSTQGSFINDPDGPLTDTLIYNTSKGEVIYPASYTIGFMTGGILKKGSRWKAGIDLVSTGWQDFRNFGKQDLVQNTNQVRIGGEFQPAYGRTLSSIVSYRAGLFFGEDYVTAGGKLPSWGASFGMGIPLLHQNRLALSQRTIVNLSLEYSQRGNNSNVLKENTFRLSAGLNFGDIWFSKKKYD
jgi:hypothetical protein